MKSKKPRKRWERPDLRVPPELKKVQKGIQLPRWLIAWLKSQDRSAAVLIEEALCEKFKLKAPEPK